MNIYERMQYMADREISLIKDCQRLIELYSKTDKENARLRKALEFYADDKTYTYNSALREVPIAIDNGQYAREALNNG